METRLIKLKGDFNNIITIRNNVKNVFDILQMRIDKLCALYNEFIKNRQTEMFIFGLDSFHFQRKLIDIEYDEMKRLFLAINNRMYCEYFKLHRIIVDYISKGITEKVNIDMTKVNNYPVYKDLEPFKDYKFETILDIHENILNLIGILMSVFTNKENELSIHKSKQTIGLNIDNFITTFAFNINVMREKITMFITYIEFFHKLHSKYLKRFSNKIQLMYTHVNNDIKFDDSVEISKNKKQELIDDFNATNVDKKLLNDLKKSIGSDTTGSDLESEDGVDNIDGSIYVKERSNTVDSNSHILNIGEIPCTPTNRGRNIKELFKRNVNKVSNILQLFKPKTDKPDKIDKIDKIDKNVSDNDLQQIFTGIEDTCNSIINDDPILPKFITIECEDRENSAIISEEPKSERTDKIEMIIELSDDSEIIVSNDIINDEQTFESTNKSDVVSEPINESVDKSEAINEVTDKSEVTLEEVADKSEPINEEPINEEVADTIEVTLESVPDTIEVKLEEPIIEEPPKQVEEPPKKKRQYNRKKKPETTN